MPHPYFDVPRPTIIGHRGAAGVAPENTIASFARALADGAHILESDIQATADGVPILLHDADVSRTTDGSGPSAELSLAALRELDAAHHFVGEDGAAARRPAGAIRVPSLEEAFEAFPDARFNLEIKAHSPALVAEVVRLVQTFGREERTLLTAGEDDIQALLRAELERSAARPALGACLADILDVIDAAVDDKPPRTDCMALQIPRDFSGRPLVTEALVSHCHAHGIVVHVWTINEPDAMHALLDLGVDGLVTDYPARMAAVLAERGH